MKNLKSVSSFGMILLLSLCMASCKGANNSLKCKQEVEKAFPDATTVASPTNEKYRFIVVDSDSSVWYVENMSLRSPKVTEKELLFKFSK